MFRLFPRSCSSFPIWTCATSSVSFVHMSAPSESYSSSQSLHPVHLLICSVIHSFTQNLGDTPRTPVTASAHCDTPKFRAGDLAIPFVHPCIGSFIHLFVHSECTALMHPGMPAFTHAIFMTTYPQVASELATSEELLETLRLAHVCFLASRVVSEVEGRLWIPRGRPSSLLYPFYRMAPRA